MKYLISPAVKCVLMRLKKNEIFVAVVCGKTVRGKNRSASSHLFKVCPLSVSEPSSFLGPQHERR